MQASEICSRVFPVSYKIKFGGYNQWLHYSYFDKSYGRNGKSFFALDFNHDLSLYRFFDGYFKSNGIDYEKYLDKNYRTVPDDCPDINAWLETLTVKAEETVNEFYLKGFGEEKGLARHWQEFDWLFPAKENLPRAMLSRSWKAVLGRRGLDQKSSVDFFKALNEFYGEDLLSDNAYMDIFVFPAMLSLLALQEKGHIKHIDRVLNTGAKLLEYNLKARYTDKLKPNEYDSIEGFDREYFDKVNKSEGGWFDRLYKTDCYLVFDRQNKYWPLIEAFYQGYYSKMRELAQMPLT